MWTSCFFAPKSNWWWVLCNFVVQNQKLIRFDAWDQETECLKNIIWSMKFWKSAFKTERLEVIRKTMIGSISFLFMFQAEYLIKWKGYSSKWNSWEPESCMRKEPAKVSLEWLKIFLNKTGSSFFCNIRYFSKIYSFTASIWNL